jgi:hypothetical protein
MRLHLFAPFLLLLQLRNPHEKVLQLCRGRILVPEHVRQRTAQSEKQPFEAARFEGSRPPLAFPTDHMYPAVIFPDDEVVRAWPASLRRTRSELDPPSPQWGTVRPNMPALDPPPRSLYMMTTLFICKRVRSRPTT